MASSSGDELDPAQLGQLVWEFDESTGEVAAVDFQPWLNRWPHPHQRWLVAVELARIAWSKGDFSPVSLTSINERLSADLDDLEKRARFGQALFQEELSAKRRPRWPVYAPLGLDPAQLDLRASGDVVSLGSVVADQFRVEERLGAGAFGVVYRAVRLVDGQDVAIKTPRQDEDGSLDLSGQLIVGEAAILNQLSLPRIPRLLGCFATEDGQPVLVMEYVGGGTLAELLRSGPLPLEPALQVVRDVSTAVDGAHRLGFVHRDLKPANILLDHDRRPYVADFGIGTAEENPGPLDGEIAGTLPYMSVDAIAGAGPDVDIRNDIWALGVLLHELVTGDRLVSASSREDALVQALMLGTHEIARTDRLPAGVARIVERATARNPWTRFDTAGDLATACECYLSGDQEHAADRVVRPLLAAWRIGLQLGRLVESHRVFSAELAPLPATATSQDRQHLGVISKALGYAHVAAIQYEELAPLTQDITVTLPDWTTGKEYHHLFYTATRGPAVPVGRLQELFEQSQAFLQPLLSEVAMTVAHSDSRAGALFEIGRHAGQTERSATARHELLAALPSSGLSREVIEAGAAVCAGDTAGAAWEATLGKFIRRLENHLRWSGDAPPENLACPDPR